MTRTEARDQAIKTAEQVRPICGDYPNYDRVALAAMPLDQPARMQSFGDDYFAKCLWWRTIILAINARDYCKDPHGDDWKLLKAQLTGIDKLIASN